MPNESLTLLSNITDAVSDSSFLYGEKSIGAGYHKKYDNLHTAIYSFNSFTGTVKIQGTLALDPNDLDWFDIEGTTLVGDESTSSHNVNFSGNFVWLRAAYNVQGGEIIEIRYNY